MNLINPFANCGLLVVDDGVKGRCLESTRQFNIGDVIYTEDAFIASSCNSLPLHECFNYVFKCFKPKELDVLEEMTDFISQLSRVNSLDTARNLLELIALYRLQQLNDEIVNTLDMKTKFQLLSGLTAANMAECVDNMKKLRRKFPSLIPAAVSDNAAGALLGILNTNQVELEDIQGSGLFVGTAIAEHNCSPSCSYSTNKTKLYMTAIKQIQPKERISIDYGNYYYDDTRTRISSLYHTYNFVCDCNMCKHDLDKKRGFNCPHCQLQNRCSSNDLLSIVSSGVQCLGVMYPMGYSITPNTSVFHNISEQNMDNIQFNRWICNSCGTCASPELVSQFIQYEDNVRTAFLNANDFEETDGVVDTPLVMKVLNDNKIHYTHHLVYWALYDRTLYEIEKLG